MRYEVPVDDQRPGDEFFLHTVDGKIELVLGVEDLETETFAVMTIHQAVHLQAVIRQCLKELGVNQ